MKKNRKTARTYRKGAWAIGHAAAQVTGSIFERHGLGHGEIVHAWPHIAGPDLARVCRPERIAPAHKGGHSRAGGTLHVLASGARAIDVHYAAGRIIAGVNALYGRKVIGKINVKISDTDIATGPDEVKIGRQIASPQDPDRFRQIHAMNLRHALARLEAGILADTPQRPLE